MANLDNLIDSTQFVEKYKLIPKQLRPKFLTFLREMPYLYDIDDELLDKFDDLMLVLVSYNHDNDIDYEELDNNIKDVVSFGKCKVYNDVIGCLLRYLEWTIPIITQRDVIEFRKKQIFRQIIEVVAYRPGNIGYELTKQHYESLCSL